MRRFRSQSICSTLPLRCLALSLLFVAIGSPPSTAEAPAAVAPVEGRWWGELVTPQETTALGLEIRRNREGELVAAVTQPGANYFGLPVGAAESDDSGHVSIESLRFEATLDGDRLRGTTGSLGLPIVLHRVRELPTRAPIPDLPAGPGPRWQTRLSGQIFASPAVEGEIVYIGTTGGVFQAVNAADGSFVWTFSAGGPLFGTARATGDAVYFVGDNGHLFALDRATGAERWRYALGDESVTRVLPHPTVFDWDWHAPRPLVTDGTVYVGAGDGGFHAVDVATGERRWRVSTDGKIRGGAALAGESVVVGSADHHLYAFDRASGRELWKHDTGAPIEDEPLVVGDRIFVGNRGRGLFALSAATGEELWRTGFWGSWIESTATLHDGVLYIGSSDLSRVSAIDPDDGRVLWRTDVFGWTFGTPLVVGDRIVAGAAGGTPYFIAHVAGLATLDRATGRLLTRRPLPDPGGAYQWGIAGSVVLAGDTLVAATIDGSLWGYPLR